VSYLDRLRALEGRGSNSLPEKKGGTPPPTKATEGASVGSVGAPPPTFSGEKGRTVAPVATVASRPSAGSAGSAGRPAKPQAPEAHPRWQVAPDPLSAESMEARRLRVVAMLAANPALRLAVVADAEVKAGDPVPVAVAIRDKGTCELHVPAARWDPFKLLELVARHGGVLH